MMIAAPYFAFVRYESFRRSIIRSYRNNILYIVMEIWSDLRVIFREEFIALEMTIREKFPIFWKIFTTGWLGCCSIDIFTPNFN